MRRYLFIGGYVHGRYIDVVTGRRTWGVLRDYEYLLGTREPSGSSFHEIRNDKYVLMNLDGTDYMVWEGLPESHAIILLRTMGIVIRPKNVGGDFDQVCSDRCEELGLMEAAATLRGERPVAYKLPIPIIREGCPVEIRSVYGEIPSARLYDIQLNARPNQRHMRGPLSTVQEMLFTRADVTLHCRVAPNG